MSAATPDDAGLASGLVNTSVQVGGAPALAVVATLSATRTDSLRDAGVRVAEALTGGYHHAQFAMSTVRDVSSAVGVSVVRETISRVRWAWSA